MNSKLKISLIVIVSIIVAIGAVAYGAATAPQKTVPAISRTSTKKPTVVIPKTPSQADLTTELTTEQSTIDSVLTAAYPKVATDYIINQGQLFDQGEWYGTTLTYKGTDTMNRETLRVLMQKKQGVWVLRTNPPELLLSESAFSDVPKSILDTINKAVSLPGTDTSPTINS